MNGRRHRLPFVAWGVGLALAAVGAAANADLEYGIKALKPIEPGGSMAVTAISSNGFVAGYCTHRTGHELTGFYYEDGASHKLPAVQGYNQVVPYGINSAGLVVGEVRDTESSAANAFVYSGGAIQLISSDNESYAAAVNDSGEVVLESSIGGAYLWANGTQTALPTAGGGFVLATAIDNDGEVVGSIAFEGGETTPEVAFAYHDGTLRELGPETTDSGYIPLFVNDLHQVCGYYIASDFSQHADVYMQGHWHNIAPQDLGSSNSEAVGIDDKQRIIGDAGSGGFVYDTTSGLSNLDDLVDPALGWSDIAPVAVNTGGRIVASATQNGVVDAVILTPN